MNNSNKLLFLATLGFIVFGLTQARADQMDDAMARLRQGCRTNSVLHGVWPLQWQRTDADDGYDLDLILDAANAQQQLALVTAAIRPIGKVTIRPRELPLSEMVATLDSAVTERIEQLGCWVSGAYFSAGAQADTLNVELFGHLYEEPQKLMVANACRRLIGEGPWKAPGLPELLVSDRGLAVALRSEQLQAALARLRAPLATDSRMHGAWVEAVECFDYQGELDHYEVYLWLEEANAEAQRVLLNRLLEQHLGRGAYEVNSAVVLPLAKLITKLRTRLEAEPSLGKGSWVNGAFYKAGVQDAVVELALYGQVFSADQKEVIKRVVDELKAADATWETVSPLEVITGDQVIRMDQVSARMRQVRQQIRDAIRADEQLHGSWVDLVECLDHTGNQLHHWDVYAWLDRDRATPQQQKLVALLDRFLGEGKHEVQHWHRLPVSYFTSQLQAAFERRLGEGCFIGGAYFEQPADPAQETFQLVAHGRLFTEAHRQSIARAFERFKLIDPSWSQTRSPRGTEILFDSRKLRLSSLSATSERALDAIRKRIIHEPALHGVWFDIAECYDHRGQFEHYDAYLWLDSDRAADQRQQMEGLFAQWIGEDAKIHLHERRLPVSRLVTDMAESVQTKLGKGCWVTGAYYAAGVQADTVELRFYGHVNKADAENQTTLIKSTAADLMRRDPAWAGVAPGNPIELIISDAALVRYEPPADLIEAQTRIRGRMKADVSLHGAWLAGLSPCFNHLKKVERYEAFLWLDPAKGEPQRLAATTLLDGEFGDAYRIAEVRELPLSRWAANLQEAAEIELGKKGCWILGAYYEAQTQENVVGLMPFGKLFTDDQRVAVMNRARALTNQDSSWKSTQPLELLVVDQAILLDQPSARMRQARQRIRDAIRANEQLHGSWVDLVECLDHTGEKLHHWDVYAWLDRDRATLQKQQLGSLLDRFLGPEQHDVLYWHELPVSRFTSRLQAAFEQNWGPGCFIGGGYFEQLPDPAQETVNLVIHGRVLKGEHRDSVSRAFERFKLADVSWDQAPSPRESEILSDTRKLRLSTLTPANKLARDAIRKRAFEDPDLHGVWLDMAECYDHLGQLVHFDVHLWLDTDRPDEQRDAVMALLDRWIGTDTTRDIHETKLPLSQLVSKLQTYSRSAFPGDPCLMMGAYYSAGEQAGTVSLNLFGNARNLRPADAAADETSENPAEAALNNKRESLTRTCERMVNGDPAWQLSPNQLLIASNLELAAPSAKLSDALAAIRTELFENADLHGAWVDAMECLDHQRRPQHLHVTLWLDTDRAAAQRQTVLALLDGWIGADAKREIHDIELPLSRLVSRLQEYVKSDYPQDPCLIMGAYYSAGVQAETISLNLYGNARKPAPAAGAAAAGDAADPGEEEFDKKREHLTRTCKLMMGAEPAWQSSPYQVLLASKLERVPRSEQLTQALVEVRAELLADVALHGVWVDAMECFDHRGQLSHHHVTLWLDTNRAEQQRPRVLELLTRWLGEATPRVLHELQFPLSQLVTDLAARVQTKPELGKGCWVTGAYYAAGVQADTVALIIFGHVNKAEAESQIGVIKTTTNELRQHDPTWASVAPGSPVELITSEALYLYEPSAALVEAQTRIRSEMRDDADLHGAWLESLSPCFNHLEELEGYEAFLWLDPAKGSQQREKMLVLLDREFGGDYRVAEETPLPLSQWAADLQTAAESIFGKKGCWIGGAYYEEHEQKNAVSVMPFGKVFDAEQQTQLINEARSLIAQAVWRRAEPTELQIVDKEILVQPKPSAHLAHLRSQIRAALKDDPRLHGAWVDLVECLDHHRQTVGYDVYLWLNGTPPPTVSEEIDFADDMRESYPTPAPTRYCLRTRHGSRWVYSYPPAQPAAQLAASQLAASRPTFEYPLAGQTQRAEVIKLLDKWLDKEYQIRYEKHLPLTQLVTWTKLWIQDHLGPGCYLMGAYFEPNVQDTANLKLYGQQLRPGQKDEIRRVFEYLQKRQSEWDSLPSPRHVTTRDSLTIDQQGILDDDPSATLQTAQVGLRRAVFENADLHGAWVELVGCKDHLGAFHHYDVYLWLDKSRASQQRVEVSKLLGEWLGPKKYEVVKRTALPLSDTIAKLQSWATREIGRGCYMAGAYYESAEEQNNVSLMLYGRVFNPGQRDMIRHKFEALKDADPMWAGARGPRGSEWLVVDKDLRLDDPADVTLVSRDHIRQAIFNNPRMHGAWFDLAECFDHFGKLDHYDVFVWLDSSRPQKPARPPVVTVPLVVLDRCGRPVVTRIEQPVKEVERTLPQVPAPYTIEQQRTVMAGLLDRWLGQDKYQIQYSADLPLAGMVSSLQSFSRSQIRKGCVVVGGYYQHESEDLVKLVLYGRVRDEAQRQAILSEAQTLMNDNPVWTRPPTFRGTRLEVVKDQLRLDTLSARTALYRERIRTAITDDPSLHGAWVDLAECYDYRGRFSNYEVYLWLDKERATRQKPKVTSMLDRWLGTKRYHVLYDVRPPASRLVARVQSKMESQFGPGSYLSGLFYRHAAAPGPENVEIAVFGQVNEDQQRQALIQLCQAELDREPTWLAIPSPRGTTLSLSDEQVVLRGVSRELNERTAAVHRAFAEKPQLHGTWAKLAECYSHRGEVAYHDVILRLDVATDEAGRRAAMDILGQSTNGSFRIAAEHRIPLSQIFAEVNLVLGVSSDFGGCDVAGGYFVVEADGDQPVETLHAYGRIGQEEQREAVLAVLKDRMQHSPVWQQYAGDVQTTAADIRQVVPDGLRASQWFSEGSGAYWRGLYAEASKSFKEATIEASGVPAYRYWLALAELQQGNNELAYAHVLAAVAQERTALHKRRAVHSLHRVQGPLRTELRRLELRARGDLYRRQHGLIPTAL